MPKNWIGGITCVFLMVGFSGCTVAKDVKVRTYKQNKKRIDQVVEGKIGNWENAPDAYRTQEKDTREVYFVEFTKEPPVAPNLRYLDDMLDDSGVDTSLAANQSDGINSESQISKTSQRLKKIRRRIVRRQRQPAPAYEEDIYYDDEVYYDDQRASVEEFETPISTAGGIVDYTVKKSDTLQKISKKFYGSYAKWPRIFNANKSTLSSPDVVAPGMVLKIPVE